ncbi:Zinc finger FYVE domain-containing protein 9 [Trachymyrmex cornetzi]|uniref:Zinc finger FYVE domain-containing protein 9 n=1 Tax=Trachymyrmex cornetzi TaxID=471704 RepID=A0A151IXM0_9HYME|nr:Zinc finger FYVE domain-containing protein 9 [Trachymyrmex cornetzi]
MFPLRLLLRLGAEYRYYPCPLVSVRFRNALYFEIGHTVMKVLADFRNFGYTLPGVRGLTIHLKNRTTDVMFPRNRYDQVIKGLHNSNDHVLAYASNFSITADSHLVCIQTNTSDESSYQTQAINIHNKPRTVTGASFIVINGALKSSMGLSAKSSIVEDGLMVEIMPEKMEALKAALKNMQDFSIGCGRQGALEPDEVVNIKWVDNDMLFNLSVKSPIDGQLMDGIPSIRVHNGIDYKGATRFIRWTEVFIIKVYDHSSGVNDPVDINKLSGNIAKATCAALVKLLDLLATAGLTKLGVRTTIHPDNMGDARGVIYYELLKPSHFLIGQPMLTVPEESVLAINPDRLSRWQLVRSMQELLWHSWLDYLHSLQQKNKWRNTEPNLAVGELVLVKNSLLPSSKWELARIQQIHPGSDSFG